MAKRVANPNKTVVLNKNPNFTAKSYSGYNPSARVAPPIGGYSDAPHIVGGAQSVQPGAHGFGHGGGQIKGKLRRSGVVGAHQLGCKK